MRTAPTPTAAAPISSTSWDCAARDAADRHAAAAGDRRGAAPRRPRRAASLWPAAISRSPRAPPNSRRPASISACSARRRWSRCRATCRAKHAMEMLLTGELISAEDAARIGLVNRVVGARPRARGSAQARGENRRQVGLDRQDRQGGVLSPGRNAARRGLQIRLRSDGREHAGARRRGRHQRLHREARADAGKTADGR